MQQLRYLYKDSLEEFEVTNILLLVSSLEFINFYRKTKYTIGCGLKQRIERFKKLIFAQNVSYQQS